MKVSTFSVVVGVLLILAGLGGWAAYRSPTALIPVPFGVLFVFFGILARKESLRRHAMHGAAAVALVGFVPSASGLLGLPALLAGEAARPAAVVLRSTMALLCLAFLVVAIRSFVVARRARAG